MTSEPNKVPSNTPDSRGIVSPFSHTTATVRNQLANDSSNWPLWTMSCVLGIVILGIITYLVSRYMLDPYRTLEDFPVVKYLSDYRSLAGAKFKASMKVSADLGWNEGVGRLMVFTTENDAHPVVVLMPPKLSGIFFTKGQNYQVSLEVGEGGLVYADSCEKE